MPSTAIQFRTSTLLSTESARAHWIAAFAAMTITTSCGRIYVNLWVTISAFAEDDVPRTTPPAFAEDDEWWLSSVGYF